MKSHNQRIALLTGYEVGLRCVEVLVDAGYSLVFVGTVAENSHPLRMGFGEAIRDAVSHIVSCQFAPDFSLRKPELLEKLLATDPDILLTIMWPEMVPFRMLAALRRPAVNLHLSLLPHNRGFRPNVWPIIDGSPAGVTLHELTSEPDQGPIVTQRSVDISRHETAQSLYGKLCRQAVKLFEDCVGSLICGDYVSREQNEALASFHSLDESEALRIIHSSEFVNGDTLSRRLRASYFPPFPGLIIKDSHEQDLQVIPVAE